VKGRNPHPVAVVLVAGLAACNGFRASKVDVDAIMTMYAVSRLGLSATPKNYTVVH
jgi:hypothetical protein